MIASIVENSYYLHCLDTQTGKMDVIKQEKIELTLAVEKVMIKSEMIKLINK
jgi:hypothetical protein